MFSQDQIAQLEGFDARDARVLSVYLDLDPATQVRRSYRVALAEEAVRVQHLLENETPRGLGLAVFSCAARGLWLTSYFAVRVRNHLAFEARPDLAALRMLVDAHERYAVALVDKATARLIVVFAGEIEAREEVASELVRTHDQGGWSQSKFQRHADTHVLWHLESTVARLTELHRRRRFDRLLLAGAEEATSEVADGVQLEGSECPNCHRLDAGVARACPTCQQPMRAVDDVVHRAMGRALEQGATVDVLHGERARRLMAQGGGLAALLRYPTAVPETVARQRQARSA
ncbi:MAG: hypothetical protein FJ027_07320 [Candidatus Rokubacteria bacterium]|nr:hypothetical protein [Candidatus Rokubacteria bacterium]